MLQSLPEFQSLSRTELARMVELGPILITDGDEPRFVAQSIEAFESMVRRLRRLERVSTRRKLMSTGQIVPLRQR
jgi:hypothetical protein